MKNKTKTSNSLEETTVVPNTGISTLDSSTEEISITEQSLPKTHYLDPQAEEEIKSLLDAFAAKIETESKADLKNITRTQKDAMFQSFIADWNAINEKISVLQVSLHLTLKEWEELYDYMARDCEYESRTVVLAQRLFAGYLRRREKSEKISDRTCTLDDMYIITHFISNVRLKGLMSTRSENFIGIFRKLSEANSAYTVYNDYQGRLEKEVKARITDPLDMMNIEELEELDAKMQQELGVTETPVIATEETGEPLEIVGKN
jgi:hypothetical protein